jgi:hypothetical protein
MNVSTVAIWCAGNRIRHQRTRVGRVHDRRVDGQVDLGVGNVVGSNAANLTLVLGATALVHRL